MRIVREEIFGPVLSIIGVYDLDEAIAVANDTEYGIAGYVAGRDPQDLQRVADGIWAGQVIVNEAPFDPTAPFGGMKRSGNGREWGAYGFHEFLELKAILGK
jgi:aldehyde dehydrogenase (NAD+)